MDSPIKYIPDQEVMDMAIKARDQADYDCYMLLDRLWRYYEHEITHTLKMNEDMELKDEIEDALERRAISNEKFLRELCGR